MASAATASRMNHGIGGGNLDVAAQGGSSSSATAEALPSCLVCYSDLTYPTVAPCGHNDICGTCHLRLRYLHKDKHCPLCKTENQQLVVDHHSQQKSFDEYPIWGEELGEDFVYRDDVGMFFQRDHYDSTILPLFGYNCTNCNEFDGTTPDVNPYEKVKNYHKNKPKGSGQGQPRTPLKALQDHLRNKHRLALCQLCVDFQRDFVAKLPRFTPTELKRHLANGDGPTSGFKGHPACAFCKPKRFYDLTQLHAHLNKDHYKCHVCDRQGLPNQFFRDYQSLEKHFDQKHFLCKDVQCIAARFVVFDNEIDLRAHELSVHGGTSTGSTKIQLEFRIRREGYDGSGYENQQQPSDEDFQYGLDGQAFVPDALPSNGNSGPDESVSDPLHVQRTADIRARAAEVREQMGIESSGGANQQFPSLAAAAAASGNESGGGGGGGGGGGHLRMGWTEGTSMQRVTRRSGVATQSQEEFPTLGGGTNNNRKPAAIAKIKAGGVSGNRQFAAMRNAALGNAVAPARSAQWSSSTRNNSGGGSGGGASFPAASATAPSMASTTNFPSLGNPSTSSRSGGGGVTSLRPAYTATPAAARAPSMTSNDFPSLGGGTQQYRAADALGRKNHQQQQQRKPATAPSFSSAAHFPAPPTSAAGNKSKAIRQKMLQKAPPTNNLANFPVPASSNLQQSAVTVDQMKAVLGPRYKKLKNLTKEFAVDGLSAQAYVDQASTLFDDGYNDADFWSFVPSLLVSCPNESSSNKAMRYMDDIKTSIALENDRQQQAASSATATWSATPSAVATGPATSKKPSGAAGGWGGAAVRTAPPPSYRTPAVGRATSTVTRNSGMPNMMHSKKKAAWGAPGSATSVRVKGAPGSVTAAAASQGPQAGTATKFMAKEQKQQKQQQNGTGGKKKKKKKNQKNELRSLAFM